MIAQSVLVVASLFCTQSVLSADKVHLDVYYESWCPDCHNFFVKQLRPVSKELNEYMETNLVPCGGPKGYRRGENLTFDFGNKVHSCALARVQGSNLKRVLLASCLFEHCNTTNTGGKICAPQYGLKWSEVFACANGSEGDTIEGKYCNETRLNPPIAAVPTIAINKIRGDEKFQEKIQFGLKKVICETLAKVIIFAVQNSFIVRVSCRQKYLANHLLPTPL